MEYSTTRAPTPVISRTNIRLRPSRIRVISTPKDGIQEIVLIIGSPALTAVIFNRKYRNRTAGRGSTNHPGWNRVVCLINSINTDSKNGSRITICSTA
ncbi:hypothetical protein D3C80_1638670 [compost metagenome]